MTLDPAGTVRSYYLTPLASRSYATSRQHKSAAQPLNPGRQLIAPGALRAH